MRFATILDGERTAVGFIREDAYLPLDLTVDEPAAASMKTLAGAGSAALRRIAAAVGAGPQTDWRPLAGVSLGPAVPDPGAIYTIAGNYEGPADGAGATGRARPERPRVLGKLPSSVAGHGVTLRWDRAVTANVDGECELGVVIGQPAFRVSPGDAMAHVFGYTIVNDLNSIDPWLDGEQWLLGKSMAGFCPLGPWVVTADELDPADVRLGMRINDRPIREGRTGQMRFSIAEVIAYISRHVELRPGDVIATGTPARAAGDDTAERHLEPGDVVTCWIEGIGELTNDIA